MNKQTAIRIVPAVCAIAMLVGPFTAHGDSAGVLALAANSTWIVDKITPLRGLTIPDGASVVAPAGSSLTMTVDAVGRPISPGTYRGRIVLTPTENIPFKSASVAPHNLRAGLFVEDGRLVRSKSVLSAVVGAVVTDTSAANLSITSKEERFNGIIVTGNSHYVITNPRIRMTGNGGDDTDGFGAGIMSSGQSDVTVNSAKITTTGAIRTALFVAGDSTMRVNDSSIEVFSGKLPADYQFNIGDGRVMMEVPWMLGLVGNVRATNAVERSTVYYNHSHIKAHGWGALSTDGVQAVRMYVNDSVIETVGSGYGAYALEDAVDTFSHCTFDVVDYGLIIGGKGTGIFTDGTRVTSHRFGVMMHQGGGGALTIDKGSVFNTKSTLIQIKGRGASIIVDNAKLHADNGILLQTMDNDDPYMKAMIGKGDIVAGAGLSPASAATASNNDVAATFSNVRLAGDLVHAMTDLGELTVSLKSHAVLIGAITTATATPSTGKEATRDTYYLIGEVRNDYGPATGTHGLAVSLEEGSEWIVRKTSYLTTLTVAEGAVVGAPKGRKLALSVNGIESPIKPGRYVGQITLRVTGAGLP